MLTVIFKVVDISNGCCFLSSPTLSYLITIVDYYRFKCICAVGGA